MRRNNHKRQHYKSPRSEIARLEEQLRRTTDPVDREGIKQHIEHWQRAQNDRR
jgi:hypothetical protein